VAAAVLVLVGYVCGSIPFGVLLARRAGVDVRREGSGNIGATNVARTAGKLLGVATLLADGLKGALPVALARSLDASAGVSAATGLAAVLGHVYPLALRFAGGKGVATALGALLVLCPLAVLPAVAVFAAVVGVWRLVSLGSILGATAAAGAAMLLPYPRPVQASAAAMALVIVVRHRDNLRRLRAGTEPRFGA
jgi:glycerol-3-phosphate acyltransferase PlsY